MADQTQSRGDSISDEILKPFGLADGQGETWLDAARQAIEPDASPLGSIGPYELLAEAARGGQGTVYKAKQPGTGRVIAIKRLGSGLAVGSSGGRRITRETRALTLLDHPGIVTVHAAEVVDAHPILVMEWVEGLEFDRWVERASPSTNTRLEVFLQVCDAVSYAHRRGVLHRDLKPSNILVDAEGRARVLDFGLAKLTSEVSEDEAFSRGDARTLTRVGSFLGTPAFTPPEQAEGRWDQVDTRSDVYSLGAVLYQACTGKSPVGDGPAVEVLQRVREGRVRPPRSVSPTVSPDLQCVLLKALMREPERRYQSVDEFADDVRRLLQKRPVLAHPPSTWYRFTTTAKRRPVLVSSSVAVAVVVIALLAISSILAITLSRRSRSLAVALESTQAAMIAAERAAAQSDAAAEMVAGLLRDMNEAAMDRRLDLGHRIIIEACDRLEREAGTLGPVQTLRTWDAIATIAAEIYPAEFRRAVAAGLPLAESLRGPDSKQAWAWRFRVAYLLEASTDPATALPKYQEVEAALARIGAVDDAIYATTVHNVGTSLKAAGRLEESESWLTRAIETRQRVHGKESAEAIRAMASLGNLRLQQKRFDEAVAIVDRIEPIARAIEEPSRKTWIGVEALRSRIATARGDHRTAELTWRSLIADCEKTLAPESPRLTMVLASLAKTLATDRRYAEAIIWLDRALRCEATQSAGGDVRIRFLIDKASWHSKLGQRAEAVDAARAARDISAGMPDRNEGLHELAVKTLERVSK